MQDIRTPKPCFRYYPMGFNRGNTVQSFINVIKVERPFPFSWNLKLYKSAPKKASTNFEFSAAQLAIIENVQMDNAQKRTYNLDPC